MGILPLTGWWTVFDGYVFNDTNRNGVKDEGEPGLPGYTLTMRKRENSLMDRGTTVATDRSGRLLQIRGRVSDDAVAGDGGLRRPALHDRRHLPGRQPAHADHAYRRRCGRQRASHHRPQRPRWIGASTPTTRRVANGIDPRNGGIVGSVSYDTTRNELDPRYAAVEDWQPSIPDLSGQAVCDRVRLRNHG